MPAADSPPPFTACDVLGGHAPPVEFEHAGKTYRLGALTLKAQAFFERGLVRFERDRLNTALDLGAIDRAEHAALLETLLTRVQLKEHRPGGGLWAEYQFPTARTEAKQAAASVLMLWSLLQEHQPGVTPDECAAVMLRGGGPLLLLVLNEAVPSFFEALVSTGQRTPEAAARERDAFLADVRARVAAGDPGTTSGTGTPP